MFGIYGYWYVVKGSLGIRFRVIIIFGRIIEFWVSFGVRVRVELGLFRLICRFLWGEGMIG